MHLPSSEHERRVRLAHLFPGQPPACRPQVPVARTRTPTRLVLPVAPRVEQRATGSAVGPLARQTSQSRHTVTTCADGRTTQSGTYRPEPGIDVTPSGVQGHRTTDGSEAGHPQPRPASSSARPNDGVEHRLGQPPGEGVLLADVVAAQQDGPAASATSAPCANGGSGLGTAHAGGRQGREQRRPAEAARARRRRARSAARAAARRRATASRCCAPPVVGLLTGGAHRTPSVSRVCRSSCPSPACVLVGWGQARPGAARRTASHRCGRR